jgi:Mg-chelatase subunit ChlD
MSKRACLLPKPASCESFDLLPRPLYKHSKSQMPLCVEIKPTVTAQAKDYTLTLIVLADVSGSMLDGAKMRNMREGIVRLGELSERFSKVKIELTLIEFNDSARLTHTSPTMPSTADLRSICERLSPSGGTNIGAAIQMAVAIALGKTAVHVALFTDGDDTCRLQEKLEAGDEPYITTLRTFPMFWLHCVGICADFDSRCLVYTVN